MQPILANACFGIYVVMPLGWLFMLATVVLEIAVLARLLVGRWWNRKLIVPAIVANVLSGAVGIFVSYRLNRGWWIVVWMPWVSSNEVDLQTQLSTIGIYYAVAFIATLAIEGIALYFWLRRRFGSGRVLRAALIANVASYLLGSVAMYSWSFGLW